MLIKSRKSIGLKAFTAMVINRVVVGPFIPLHLPLQPSEIEAGSQRQIGLVSAPPYVRHEAYSAAACGDSSRGVGSSEIPNSGWIQCATDALAITKLARNPKHIPKQVIIARL